MSNIIALTRSIDVRLADRPPRFAQALTLLFVTAQLWGRIDWPWWWLASPMWIAMTMLAVASGLKLLREHLERKSHER